MEYKNHTKYESIDGEYYPMESTSTIRDHIIVTKTGSILRGTIGFNQENPNEVYVIEVLKQ